MVYRVYHFSSKATLVGILLDLATVIVWTLLYVYVYLPAFSAETTELVSLWIPLVVLVGVTLALHFTAWKKIGEGIAAGDLEKKIMNEKSAAKLLKNYYCDDELREVIYEVHPGLRTVNNE